MILRISKIWLVLLRLESSANQRNIKGLVWRSQMDGWRSRPPLMGYLTISLISCCYAALPCSSFVSMGGKATKEAFDCGFLYDLIERRKIFLNLLNLDILKRKKKDDGRIVNVGLKSPFVSLINSPCHQLKYIALIYNSEICSYTIWIRFIFLSFR